jgi:hypothetical protein
VGDAGCELPSSALWLIRAVVLAREMGSLAGNIRCTGPRPGPYGRVFGERDGRGIMRKEIMWYWM